MDRIARQVDEWTGQVGAMNGCLHLLSIDRRRLLCQAVTTGYRATQLAHGLSLDESKGASRALATGELVVVDEAISSGLVAPVAAEKYGIRACIYAPIVGPTPGVHDGVLVFSYKHPHVWSAEQREAARRASAGLALLLAERLARSSPEEPQTRSERRLRALLDVAPGLLAAVDRDFIIYEANHRRQPGAQSGEQHQGSGLLRWVLRSPRRAEIEQAIDDIHKGNLGHASFLIEAGEATVKLDLAPIYTSPEEHDIEGVGLACTDITEALAAKRLLEESQRMATLGQIAARVAHEFNNILQGVSVSADLLELEQDIAEEHLLGLRQAVTRGAKLARELLSMSSVHPPVFRQATLASVVQAQWQLLQSAVGRDHDLVLIVRRSPEVQLDQDRVHLAILNLCINARDASPPGSAIEVIVNAEQGDDGRSFATLTVADKGTGMTPEVAARAVEPFFTTKPRGKGTGLGLALVKSAIDAHQGRFAIQSEVGQGTRITLGFPAKGLEPQAPAEAPALSPKATGATGATGAGRRVLVVEDEEQIGRFFEGLLRREGYQVQRVTSVTGALSFFEKQPGWPELVLLDMTLPDGSGRAIFEAIAGAQPGLFFVVCTGFAESADTGVIHAAGHPLLAKPVAAQTLLDTVRGRLSPLAGAQGNQGKLPCPEASRPAMPAAGQGKVSVSCWPSTPVRRIENSPFPKPPLSVSVPSGPRSSSKKSG